MLRRTVLTVGVCLLAAVAAAQTEERLTLGEATTRALAKNRAIRIERDQVSAAAARSRSAAGVYDAQLRIDLTGRHHRDPINSLLSGAPTGRAAASENSFGSSVTISQLFRTGAVASASTSVAREGTDAIFSPFTPAYTSSLGVDLQQPLLRNRAIDSARTSILVTALDRDRSSATLTSQVLTTVADVETAYWTLVAARRELEVRRGSLALAEQQRADTQVRIEARTVAVSDLAQPTAEVERRRGDVFAASEAVQRAERALKLLIVDDLDDALWAAPLAPVDRPDAIPQAPDLARSLADAARERPEIAELRAQVSQQDLQVRLVRDGLKPRLDLVANYTIRGMAGDIETSGYPFGNMPLSVPSSLSGGFGNSWRTLFDRTFPDAVVGFTFEMPIGGREAKGRVDAAEANRRSASTRLSQLQDRIAAEVLNAVTAIETAAGRIDAARAGLAAAQTQLQAEQDRFAAGLSTNFFVLTRQNDLALAQLAEIAALTDYRKAQTELARASGSLLRDRSIRVERQ